MANCTGRHGQRSSNRRLEILQERFVELSTVLHKNIGVPILSCFYSPYSRRGEELPKVIVSRSFATALFRCFIHLLPMAATVVVAYLNLVGYFIGDRLDGEPQTQTFNFLLIQVAAKVMELCIVSSLTSTVLSLVRHQALAKDGIPLGLLCSSFRFAQISYFWSPEYLFGGSGIKSRKKRIFSTSFLILCGLLAIFAGPSSALLMVPVVRNAWPAGGTDFWLVGTDDTLWPDRLNSTHIGSEGCRNPSKANLTSAPLYMAQCIWHGYTQLAEGLKDRNFDWQSNITINDGMIKRQLTRRQFIASNTETWVLGVHVAASWLSRVLADEWGVAIRNASSAQGSWRNARLKKATDGYGVTKVDTWLPVSRVACFNYAHIGRKTNLTLDFPTLPEFAPRSSEESFPVNLQLIGNTTDITTQWVQPPKETRNSSLTAALVVRIPHGTDSSAFTCSIDARWARGTNIGTGLPNTDNMLVHGALKTTRTQSTNTSNLDSKQDSYLPSPDSDWRFVNANAAWLDALIPPITTTDGNNSNNGNRQSYRPGWTTLAATLTDAGFDNSTGAVSSWPSLGATIESTLASVFVDGLSRVGLSANGGGMQMVIPDRYQWLRFLPDKYVASKAPSFFDRLLAGRTVVLPPADDQFGLDEGVGGGNLVRLRWSITVSGLAFKADSVGYYLALAVLFAHFLIASAHIAWTLVSHRSSEAWDGVEQLIVLGCQSKQPSRSSPDSRLDNTCGGIRYGRTFQCPARIAVVRSDNGSPTTGGGNEEAVQLLLDHDASSGTLNLEEVREDISYGVTANP